MGKKDALSASLLLTAITVQVFVQGQPFTGGKQWDHDYTIVPTPPESRAYIYRALRDAPEHKVVLFAEVAEDVVAQITHCFLQPFQQANLTLPATVIKLPAGNWGVRNLPKGSYALEEFVPVRVDCALPEGASFEYAAASLMAGVNPIIGVTEVTDVPTERVGRLAACIGPLVTGSISPEWLDHHEKLGVERFYSFVPTGKEYTDGKYNTGGHIPENILDYLQWSGVFKPEPIRLTPRASVEYMPYMPPATTWYFGQFAMMHACWYMQRYAFDFLMNVDADEYFWLRSDFMGVRKPLQAWLEKASNRSATVLVERYTYPPQCQPQIAGVPLILRADTRFEKPHGQHKLILRPKAPDEIHIKHFRDGSGWYRYDQNSECDKLTTDPPEWRPQGKLPAWRHNL